MKAMIFAAGLGTRLKPITDNKPKALVEVNGKPLLEHVISRLQKYGYSDIIINIHHFAEQIKDFLKHKNNFGIHIEISDESDELLDTGGGLKKALWFFNDGMPFLVHNVDVLSDVDLESFYQSHIQSNSIATLAVRQRKTSRYFLFDDMLSLCGWKNTNTGEIKISKGNSDALIPLAFSGIQVLSPEIFELINETGKFSMIDVYLRLATYNRITGFRHNTGYWYDLGKPDSIRDAEYILYKNKTE
ncbi:MAG: nucleotidyltransferase family protein [Bacteroidales bacterium]